MTPTELKQFRSVLEAREAELERVFNGRETIDADSSADLFDQIQHASERDLTAGNIERDTVRLRQVRAALDRVVGGRFGWCLECEEEISLKRLAAMPWAALCLACGQAAESRRAPRPISMTDTLLDAS
jgi:DnaK suppressor protein